MKPNHGNLKTAAAGGALLLYGQVIDGFVAAGGGERLPLAILGVRQEYLDAAFAEMEAKYGTIITTSPKRWALMPLNSRPSGHCISEGDRRGGRGGDT